MPFGKGTVPGLSTVLGMVRSQVGLVEVKTLPWHGPTFTVYLPAALQDLVQVGLSPWQASLIGDG